MCKNSGKVWAGSLSALTIYELHGFLPGHGDCMLCPNLRRTLRTKTRRGQLLLVAGEALLAAWFTRHILLGGEE